jgi:hypothetical protein
MEMLINNSKGFEIKINSYKDFKELPLKKKLIVVLLLPIVLLILLLALVVAILAIGVAFGAIILTIPLVVFVLIVALSIAIIGTAIGLILYFFRSMKRNDDVNEKG